MNKLVKLRIDKGMTRKEVSDKSGVNYQSLSSYEQGNRNPKIEQLIKLSKFYGVEISELKDISTVELKNDNRLKEIREENGLTLKELSKLVGLASNTLSQYENKNREPTLEIWKRLAKFFNVTPQYLVGWTDEPH